MADYRQLQETRQRNGISININITILEIYTYIWTLYRDASEGILAAVYGFSFNLNNSASKTVTGGALSSFEQAT